MASQCWLLPLLILGTNAIALIPAARQSNQESLKSALDVVARKQRFLDEAETPEYYNELHSFKYHGGDANRKFDRDFDDDDEEFLTEGEVDDQQWIGFCFIYEVRFISIDFVVISDNGQLKTIGEDIQGLDNKLFERALHDYLEDRPDQVGSSIMATKSRFHYSVARYFHTRLDYEADFV